MINYSIIIPHHNIPSLLYRCLESIPTRDDLEIIIVDDASDVEIVCRDSFPGTERSDTKVIFLEQNKGAGAARNAGLRVAIGTWIIFADADDFFECSFFELLDSYLFSDSELILFKTRSCMSDDISKPGNRTYYNQYVDDLLDGDAAQTVLLKSISPWAKMIRRDFLIRYNLEFEEVKFADDVLWGTKLAVFASKVIACPNELYVVTERRDSQVASISEEKLMIQYKVLKNSYLFLVENKGEIYKYPWAIEMLPLARTLGISTFLRFLKIAYSENYIYSMNSNVEKRFNYRHPYLYSLLLLLRLL